MSSSNLLLNKKGPLATVWVAAFRRVESLTRDQVESTDIVASVDKILQDDQAPQRILSLLLLGIVKIYCLKAEYLFDDCNKTFRSLGPRRRIRPSTSTGKSLQLKEADQAGRQKRTNTAKKSVHTVRITQVSSSISSEGLPVMRQTEINVQASVVVREEPVSVDLPAFTMPESFELDSFDLGIADDMYDDGEDHHQLRLQDISLEDQRRHAPFFYELNQRAVSSHAVDSSCLMPEYISLPPELTGAISEVNNILDLSTSGLEVNDADSVWLTPVKEFTPVKDVLSPETMEIVAEGKDPSNKSKMGDESIRKLSMGELAGSTSSVLLPESQASQISKNVLVNMTSASPCASYPTIEEPETGLFLGQSNTGSHVGEFHDHETEENVSLGKSNTEPPVDGFQEHDAEEHELLEPPILSCETRAMNDLKPWTPEALTEGPPLSSALRVRSSSKMDRRESAKKGKRKYYSKQDYLPTEREQKRQRRLMSPVLDEVLRLPNDMMRATIEDASDLIRTRKEVLHTCLDIWKAAKIGSLPHTFMDPLIPYQTPVNLASFTMPEAPGESVKARRRLSYKLSKSNHSCGEVKERERFDEPRKRKLGRPTDSDALVACCTENGHLQDDVHGCNDNTAERKDTQGKGDEPISVIQSDEGLYESETHTSLHDERFHATANEDTQDKGDEPISIIQSDKGLHESETHTLLHDEPFHATANEDTPGKGDEPISAIQSDKGLHESETHTSLHDETFHAIAKEKDTQGKVDEPSSAIQSDRDLHESENHTSLHNETHADPYEDEDISMNEEHTRDGGLLNSRRTRKIASSLHQLFLDRNDNDGTSSVSLSHALEGKERRTAAIFFYETLVLKNRGLIQVNQEQPYEDIMILPTPQLEAELGRDPDNGTSC